MKKIKILLIALSVSALSFIGFGFTDAYFELSKNLEIFVTLLKEVNRMYVDDIQPGKMIKTGIDAMLKSLDPYTVYYPESDIEDYQFMTTGQYGGIGAIISRRDSFVVVSEPYQESPAVKAGLMAGDILMEVNGKSTVNKTTREMSSTLKGEAGTTLNVKIKRPGVDELIEKEIIREEIKIADVPYFGMLDSLTGYAKLNSFTRTASSEVKKAFTAMKDSSGMKKFILDLRGNGGGLLNEAVRIVNIFTSKGQEVVSTKGKTAEWSKIYTTKGDALDKEIPLIILVDGGSASASEIVAGTLQDIDRGVIIGQNSYGKGLVQQTVPLNYNSQLKVTVAKYYTPSGRCIQRLDYGHKDKEGHAIEIADSLIAPFKTKNGRPVFDGAGILPDITIEDPERSVILESLYMENLFFDFATNYRIKHDSIPPAKEFKLSDEEYEEFVAFTKEKKYEYETYTEIILKELEETAKKEELSDTITQQITAFQELLEKEKSNDIYRHKAKIKRFLENEIVSRYYYQRGRIEISLATDEYIQEALKLFANSSKYNTILAGTNVSIEN